MAENQNDPLSPADPQTPSQLQEINVVTPTSEVLPEVEVKTSRSKRKLPILAVVGILLFFLMGGTGVLAYGITYNKIPLANSSLKQAISAFVLSLPFMPKTPEYLLAASYNAHKNVTSNSFDVSIAATSNVSDQLLPEFGFSDFDLALKGRAEFANRDNIKATTNLAVNGLEAEVVVLDKNIYFKINKVPTVIFSLIGVQESTLDSALGKWVNYNFSKIDSEARKMVDKAQEEGSEDDDKLPQIYEKLVSKGFFDRIVVTTETYEGERVYKLVVKLEDKELNILDEVLSELYPSDFEIKPTEIVSGPVNLEILMGNKDYLVKKLALSTKVDYGDQTAISYSAPEFTIAIAAQLGEYNVPFDVLPPAEYISTEDYIRSITDTSVLPIFNPDEQFARARDTERQSHLLQITNAIYQYAAEHNGNLPGGEGFPTELTCIGTSPDCFDLASQGGVDSIVPTYIASIPSDPSVGTSEDTGYEIYITTNGRIYAQALGELVPEITVQR